MERTGEPLSLKRKLSESTHLSSEFITPVKLPSSAASRKGFKIPFKSPMTSPDLHKETHLGSPGDSGQKRASSTVSCPSSSPSPSPVSMASPRTPINSKPKIARGGFSSARRGITDPLELQAKIEELRKKELAIDVEIAALEDKGLREADLQRYMTQMHEYNELKDAAQTTFGRLANIRECMVRDIYEDLGLKLDA